MDTLKSHSTKLQFENIIMNKHDFRLLLNSIFLRKLSQQQLLL